ncbi:hypothetical protein [Catellatospora sp. NPDC049609]|uniref:hypothetical protein n=1 Tax=Catellatospora sp. NPDC049609 TaxID=3155505 RepID=UPI00341A0A5C
MRLTLIIIGVLLVLAGGVWTLQGLNMLGGSAMSGDTTWAVIGPITMVVGVVLALLGWRKRDGA